MRVRPEAIVAFALAAILVVLIWIVYHYNPASPTAFLLSIIVAIATGFLLTLGAYLVQQPKLEIVNAEDKYNPDTGPFFFVHVLVNNRSTTFLGGGVALDCEGVLKFGKEADLTPKWASRPEPLDWHLVPTQIPDQVKVIPWIDWWIMEDCRFETIGPGEKKSLDILVKVRGDKNAYLHAPENYRDPLHKRAPGTGGILKPGTHELSLILKYRGGTCGPYKIKVHNQDSDVADSVSIEVAV